jgi:hypothetical protein
MLVSTWADTTAVVWDLAGVPVEKPVARSLEEVEKLYADLLGADAAVAFRAICQLAESPRQSLPLLRQRLSVKAEIDGAMVKKLIGELGDPDQRKQAAEELWRLGRRVEPALQAAPEGKPNATARAALRGLLARFKGYVPPPDVLQAMRAVEAIERAGGPAARKVLEQLTRGDDAELVALAWAALARVARREMR